MKFQWGDKKYYDNLRKHKITFEEAETVFYDEAAVEFKDITHSKNEDRFIIIGESNVKRILLVCFCKREFCNDEEIIRIISARKATLKERRLFYE